jgi:hypothetical protein
LRKDDEPFYLVGAPNIFVHGPLKVGTILYFYPIPPWYVKLWRWFKRVVLRRKEPPPPPPRTITHIDYETRTVTFS